jgi:hypothetical protein
MMASGKVRRPMVAFGRLSEPQAVHQQNQMTIMVVVELAILLAARGL